MFNGQMFSSDQPALVTEILKTKININIHEDTQPRILSEKHKQKSSLDKFLNHIITEDESCTKLQKPSISQCNVNGIPDLHQNKTKLQTNSAHAK